MNYDDSIEPVPTEEGAASYLEQLTIEEEEEHTLLSRFSGEKDLADWYVAVLFTVLLQQVCFASVMLENLPQFCPCLLVTSFLGDSMKPKRCFVVHFSNSGVE